MPRPKFRRGDLVKIANEMPEYMKHFPKDAVVIVVDSYATQYGSGSTGHYQVCFPCGGTTSWYNEDQLTLLERCRCDLLEEWTAKYQGWDIQTDRCPICKGKGRISKPDTKDDLKFELEDE
jgi:hypothetical protein